MSSHSSVRSVFIRCDIYYLTVYQKPDVLLTQMIKAIWPPIAHLPNHLPPSAGITTSGANQSPLVIFDNIYVFSGMLCYFLYWFIQFPFMFVSPQRIRPLFLAKAILVPPTWLALLIWAFVRVPPNNSLLAPKTALGSKELSWAWLSAFNSAIGFFATAGVNIPDFTVSNGILYKHYM